MINYLKTNKDKGKVLIYSVYESTDYRCEAVEDEIIGFRLLEIC